jgi:hypothetical protein
LDARLKTLFCKKIILAQSKEVKTGCSLVESSKEGCGSKGCFSNDDDEFISPSHLSLMMTTLSETSVFFPSSTLLAVPEDLTENLPSSTIPRQPRGYFPGEDRGRKNRVWSDQVIN